MTRLGTALLAALVTAGTLAGLATADPARQHIGEARAIDGYTIEVGAIAKVRVRLFGIDAPEAAQTCYRAVHATRALQHMLARDPWVTCEPKDTDRHGRMVAVCVNSEGDLGARLVATGHAIAYRRYSNAYADHEAAAKAERLGIWSGSFQQPEAWRRENRR